ncbi:hypothetical protein GDO81_013915 [Engystomops pustulosus]|uniref:Nicotinamide N-methyltransferase n=1 Tax=Engystomops pustulosus TaxID=76066 RepID=A0AAV7B6J0_ENGPU|nr:hypothetical protein GDO81_013915 [Engystomops pustulosus]
MKGNKVYHQKEFSAKEFFETCLSADSHPAIYEEVVCFPMRQLHKELSSGHIKGKTLIEFTLGPVLFKLLVCCEYFEEITVLEFNDECSMELKKWLKKHPEAIDWTHVSQFACSLDGKSNGWREKNEKVRERVKQVIDCDITADTLVAPGVLPPADCLLCIWGLDVISKDQDDFQKNLEKMAALLKSGGHLLLFGTINAELYKVGEHSFHIVNYDEEFLRKALRDCGFVIESLENRPRGEFSDSIIYDSFVYVRARKVRNP